MSIHDIRTIGSAVQRASPSHWRTIMGSFLMSKFCCYVKPAYGFIKFYQVNSKHPMFNDFKFNSFSLILISKSTIDSNANNSQPVGPIPRGTLDVVAPVKVSKDTCIMIDPSSTTSIFVDPKDDDAIPAVIPSNTVDSECTGTLPTILELAPQTDSNTVSQNLQPNAETAEPVDQTPITTEHENGDACTTLPSGSRRKRSRKGKKDGSTSSTSSTDCKRVAGEATPSMKTWSDVLQCMKESGLSRCLRKFRVTSQCTRINQIKSMLEQSHGFSPSESSLLVQLCQQHIVYCDNSIGSSAFMQFLFGYYQGTACYVFNGLHNDDDYLSNLKLFTLPMDSCCQALAGVHVCMCKPFATLPG